MARVMVAVVLTLSLCAACQAAETAVTGMGAEKTEVMPDEMRMEVTVEVKAPTIQEAVAAYKTRAEALGEAVKAAGAVPETVVAGAPKPAGAVDEQSNPRAYYQRMMSQRGAEQNEGDAGKPVALTFVLKGTWKLSSTTVEELLMEAAGIEEKVSAIEFKAKPAPSTPEEAEEMEEMEGIEQAYSDGSEGPAPGKPAFTYAKALDAETVDGMMAAAIEKAKADAQHTATLARISIVGPKSVTTMTSGGQTRDPYASYRFSGMGEPAKTPEDARTAVASFPGRLTFTVYAWAGFDTQGQ